MSFDLFLSCFKHGEMSSFPVALLEQAFHSFDIKREEPTSWRLSRGDADRDSDEQFHLDFSASGADRARCFGFCINRPMVLAPLYGGLLSLLLTTNSVLYWPGCEKPLAGRSETVGHVPRDMIAALGAPAIISSVDDIAARIVK